MVYYLCFITKFQIDLQISGLGYLVQGVYFNQGKATAHSFSFHIENNSPKKGESFIPLTALNIVLSKIQVVPSSFGFLVILLSLGAFAFEFG